ncbi:MAG: VOC family protein [Actinomycetia bacterium]|nr:VOC family protein [Actinomycetes bacterium]
MEILWLEVADPPELWRELGFTVGESPGGGSSCVVNGVEHRLVGRAGTRRGVIGWGVRGIDGDIVSIDGITTTVVNESEPAPSTDHANGVFRIDHLVVRTPSTPRTAAALESIGLEIRGGRTTNSAGTSVDMRFAWAGGTLLELAGPPSPEDEAKPARLAGIAYATNDLDATAAFLGDRSTTPVDAVQPGRRIAAVRSEVGSTVPIAFMTPHVKA